MANALDVGMSQGEEASMAPGVWPEQWKDGSPVPRRGGLGEEGWAGRSRAQRQTCEAEMAGWHPE